MTHLLTPPFFFLALNTFGGMGAEPPEAGPNS